MNKYKFISKSEEETMDFAKMVAQHLHRGDIVCLFGDLGSGKTTFVKGLASVFGILPRKVNSPTFTLINEYKGKKGKKKNNAIGIYHFDLYRLDSVEEINIIGYDEFLYGDGIAVIEWAERFKELMPKEYLHMGLKFVNEQSRAIECWAKGKQYEKIMDKLAGKAK